MTGGESGAVVRTAFGKREAIGVDTSLEETRWPSSTSFYVILNFVSERPLLQFYIL